jgi:hypothetical protein
MALAGSSGSQTFYGFANAGDPDWMGFMLGEAAVVPLPALATFGTQSGYLPLYGFTGRLF